MTLNRRYSLSRHGIAYRFNGIPKYDTDPWSGEQVITGVVYEPRWSENDLTSRHWNELAAWFAEDRAAFDERPDLPISDARLLHALMDRNGVEHRHVRGPALMERRPAFGYECAMCGDAIVAKDPGDAPFYGGPLDGRWVVTGGAPIWRAPVPVPLTLAADDPMPTAAFPTIEYRRGRDGAYYVDRQSYP